MLEALGIGEAEAVAVALALGPLAGQPLGPEVERLGGRDPPADAVDHPVTGAPRRGARVLEEGDVRAGAALLVGVEEVIDGRVVLVHRLLHEPQSQYARVEVDVAAGVAGDGGDVMDALELHAFTAYSRTLP